MKRLWSSQAERRSAWRMLLGVCVLGGLMFTGGCGPGLVAAGGGSVGAIFGLQSNDDDDKDGGSESGETNVLPAVVVTGLTRQESPAAIEYTILDPNEDLCSVEVEFAVGGGAFAPCLSGAGGDGLIGLASSAGGVAHTFSWDFATELGPQFTGDITIRIRANDGVGDGSWFSLTDQVIGNDAPEIRNIQAVGTDTVLITFDIADQNSDPGSIALSYSTDQGQNFTPVDPAEIIGNPPANLLTSPGGSPGQFIWDSGIALLGFVGEVLIRFETYDQPAGYSTTTFGAPVVEGPFEVDNRVNGPPLLDLQTQFEGASFVGEVPIEFTLADQESDAAVVLVEYSLNGGADYFNATLVGQYAQGVAGPFPTGPSPSPFWVTWNALADIAQINPYVNDYSDVRLRFTPGDAQLSSVRTVTNDFKLTGNQAPQVLRVDPLQDAGNVPVVIELIDSNADPVSASVEYTTDGTTYLPLSPADFAFGSPSNLASSEDGADNVLIWDTSLTFDGVTEPENAAAVRLRVTPTDHPPGAPAAVKMTGSAFVSAPFPIINNPAGADPVSIQVFTTDAAGTPHANPQVTVTPGGTVYLDRVVSPSSAVVQDTLWRIDEIAGDYGMLLDVSGAAPDFATGDLTCAPGGAINDGDTFTIHDGLNTPVTFEFDNNSVLGASNLPVAFNAGMTADEIAQEVASAINASQSVRIDALSIGGGAIDLAHEIACNLGNAVSNGGNADDITFSGGVFTSVTQLSGGAGSQRVRFDAPVSPPAGSDYVTLFCEIDDPSFVSTVRKSYRLYWGDPPTSVSVSPTPVSVLVGTQQQFTAQVNPAGAPQRVTWKVAGGSVNGTIDATGLYTAPGSVPAGGTVTIEAASVDPNVPAGTASVTIQPEPTSVTVTPPADNPPDWEDPDLLLGASIQFSKSVQPANAPQDVHWRIIWDGQDWGSGNSTVGKVGSNGVYTAPLNLPSPDTLTIRAVSQVKPSVYGGYSIRLKAPPPTDFDVDPATATVTAGGAGQQFQAINFTPANANQSVQWEISPLVGHIDATGFYTPPASVNQQQVVTVTARSSVASTVTATASVTVDPSLSVQPTDLVITPDEGVTFSAGPEIKFSASVLPSSASQSVTWSFVGPAFGVIDPSGKYTPAQANRDRTVTLRCESTVDPQVFDTVVVRIAGDGQNWLETGNVVIGRGAHTVLWDGHNQRQWIIGGRTELSGIDHTLEVSYIDYAGTAPAIGSYAPLPGTSLPNTVAAAFDADNDRILAFVGQGALSRVQVWQLDVTGVPAATWQQITPSLQEDVPSLGGSGRYPCWFDDDADEIQLMIDNASVYRFDVDTNQWQSRILLGNLLQAPSDVSLLGHAYFDASRYQHYFIGASDASSNATNQVFTFEAGTWRWSRLSNAGTSPGGGLRYPSCYYLGGTFHVFGGRQAGQTSYNSDLYSFSVSGGTATWQQRTLPATSHTPLPRGSAFFGTAGLYGAYLLGGEIRTQIGGVFGDLWTFDASTGEFKPFNPDGIRPQGRERACGAMKGGEAWLYGGVCSHGVSDELWRMTYNSGTAEFNWMKVDSTGDRPPPLRDATMVHDTLNGVMVLFGGNSTTGSAGGFHNDTWILDTTTAAWTKLSATNPPSARHGHAAAWDTTRHSMWIYGGEDAVGLKSGVWRLDLSSGPGSASWSPFTVSNTPPDPRVYATLGYDPSGDRLLMIGGDSSVSGPNRQLYRLELASAAWAPVSVGNAAGALAVNRTSGIYDDDFARFLHLPVSVKEAHAAVMASGGASWQYLTPPAGTNGSGGTGLYDPLARRYYSVFGLRTVGGRVIGTNAIRKLDFD